MPTTDDDGRLEASVADDVLDSVREIVGRGKATILPHHELKKDLGIDSLEFVRLVQVVEENVDVLLGDEEAAKVVTVADLVALTDEAVRKKAR